MSQALVVDVVIKLSILLGTGGMAALLLRRRSAAARHLVWALALGGGVALALWSPVAPNLRIPILPAPESSSATPAAGSASANRASGESGRESSVVAVVEAVAPADAAAAAARTDSGDPTWLGPVAGSVRAGTGAGNLRITVVGPGGEAASMELQSCSGSLVLELELPAEASARFYQETAYTRGFERRTRIESDWEPSEDETTTWRHGILSNCIRHPRCRLR